MAEPAHYNTLKNLSIICVQSEVPKNIDDFLEGRTFLLILQQFLGFSLNSKKHTDLIFYEKHEILNTILHVIFIIDINEVRRKQMSVYEKYIRFD